MHALYYKLLHTKYREGILEKSRFTVIDFNGEYRNEYIFGFPEDHIERYDVDTRSQKEMSKKVEVSEEYIINPDVLIMLFEARPGVQAPFIRRAIGNYKEKIRTGRQFAKLEMGLLKRILTTGNDVRNDALQSWITLSTELTHAHNFDALSSIEPYNIGNNRIRNATGNDQYIHPGQTELNAEQEKALDLLSIKRDIETAFDELGVCDKVRYCLSFEFIYQTA